MSLEKILWRLFTAFVFLIPLSQFLSVRILVVTAVLSAGYIIAKGKFQALARSSWDIWLYLIILIIGLLYSEDVRAGLSTLETSFSLLAIPVVMTAISPDRSRLVKINYSFVFGLLLACIICLGGAFVNYSQSGEISFFAFENLTGILKHQPTYIAYYLIFGISIVLYALFYWESPLSAYTLIGILVVFFIVLMLSGGKTAFISLLLTFSFFILKFLLEQRTSHKTLVFGIVVTMTFALLFVNTIDYWNERLITESDYWHREALWKSAVNASPNPWVGVGTGADRMALNDYYRSHNLNEFAEKNFNAHNQFLQTYITNGLIGLLALIILLARPLYFAVSTGDSPGILFIFPFLIYGITEVFLGRYQGVVFFALLHHLVITRNYIGTSNRTLKME